MRSSRPGAAGHFVDESCRCAAASGAGLGCARARRVNDLARRGPSRCAVVRRNLRRTGRVEEQVPDLDARAGRAVPRRGSATARRRGRSTSAPQSLLGGRDCSVTWATPPIEASASPRKPRVPMRNRSSALRACWWRGWRRRAAGRRGRCRGRHRRRGSVRRRPARRRCRCGVLPASTLFSSSSLTTLAGRSITSPAAILVMTTAVVAECGAR